MAGKRLRSPIKYVGGKGRMITKLLQFIPKHHTYVEPFGGGASLLFAKEPSPIEIYNDIDETLVSFFRVLRNPEKFAKFYHLVTLTPYSRAEFNTCRKTWQDEKDEVKRVYRMVYHAKTILWGNWRIRLGLCHFRFPAKYGWRYFSLVDVS